MTEYKHFLAELKVTYEKKDNVRKVKIGNSTEVATYFKQIWPEDINYKECFMVLYLNRANNTIGYSVISKGGVSSTIADVRIIMQEALLCNASAIILAHNHPSGNMKASQSDIQLTNKINEACKIMEISLLDHLILSELEFYSFTDEGIL